MIKFINGKIYSRKNFYSSMIVDNGVIASLENHQENKDLFETIDLQNKTVIPAFLDAHSHFFQVVIDELNLKIRDKISITDLKIKIDDYISKNKIPAGAMIIISLELKYFSDNDLIALINQTYQKNQLIIQSSSGHKGIVNNLTKKRFHLNSNVLLENEYFAFIKKTPLPPNEAVEKAIKNAEKIYLQNGYSTVMDAYIVKEMIPLYSFFENNRLDIDLVGYMDFDSIKQLELHFNDYLLKYKNGLKVLGIKLFIDGSVQEKTAVLYDNYMDGSKYTNLNITSEKLKKAINYAKKHNYQLIAHANGDKAIDFFLKHLQEEPLLAFNPVIIHSLMLGENSMDEVIRKKVIPSFFVKNLYYFGDIHLKNLSFLQTSKLCLLNTCLKKGILFNTHTDAPVVDLNPFIDIETAISRRTIEKKIINSEEKIDIFNALDMVTINVAKMIKEDQIKGSIEVNKSADFLILSNDLFTVPTTKIKEIKVEHMYLKGKKVF